jgi:hypothetical protein
MLSGFLTSFILLLSTLVCISFASLVLIQASNTSLQLNYFAPPLRYNETPNSYQITARVVDGSIPNINVNGCIVIFYSTPFYVNNTWDRQAFLWAQQGASAVLLGALPFFGRYFL